MTFKLKLKALAYTSLVVLVAVIAAIAINLLASVMTAELAGNLAGIGISSFFVYMIYSIILDKLTWSEELRKTEDAISELEKKVSK